MWSVTLADKFGTGKIVRSIGPFDTLGKCLDRFSNLTQAECEEQTGDIRWVWAATGPEDERHEQERKAWNLVCSFRNETLGDSH